MKKIKIVTLSKIVFLFLLYGVILILIFPYLQTGIFVLAAIMLFLIDTNLILTVRDNYKYPKETGDIWHHESIFSDQSENALGRFRKTNIPYTFARYLRRKKGSTKYVYEIEYFC